MALQSVSSVRTWALRSSVLSLANTCSIGLKSGLYGGKYRSAADIAKSLRGKSTTDKYLNPRGLRILSALDQVAAGIGQTPARVAVAWLVARPGVTSPIASATSLAQLADLVAAAQLVLPPDAIATLDTASA